MSGRAHSPRSRRAGNAGNAGSESSAGDERALRGASESKLIARGLRHPGPVHMLRTHVASQTRAGVVRVIVDNAGAADGLARYCQQRDVPAEVDLVGEEFHVLIRMGANAQALLRGDVDEAP